ncbi:hypothetical protein FQZ97_862310 [compost metagenome]
MSHPGVAQVSLRQINEKLKKLGLQLLRPEQVPAITEHASRERFIEAIQQLPGNESALRFVRTVIERVTASNEADDTNREGSAIRNMADEKAAPIQQAGDQDRASFHVYGGKAALCFEADTTRNGVHTIALDAATVTGPKQYNWGKKVRLQLTRSELPIVAAVLLGALKRCEFKNHGQDNSKGFSLERQDGGKVFIKVMAKGESVKAVPVEAPDVFFITALFVRQLQKGLPWLDAAGVLALIRATQTA